MTDLLERSLPALDETGRALLFTDARTANSFADIPVSNEELTQIWELARWAPSQANQQPLRVTFVQSPEARAKLVAHLNEGNKAKTLNAPAVALLSTDTRFHEHAQRLFPIYPQLGEQYEADEAARAEVAAFNAALQAGYFILAVRALGLAAGPMKGYDAAGIDAEFFPDGRQQTVLVVNIGHPGENAWFPRLPRLVHDEVVTFA
jgi:3-hydroxypropanoate dehydrogenase